MRIKFLLLLVGWSLMAFNVALADKANVNVDIGVAPVSYKHLTLPTILLV